MDDDVTCVLCAITEGEDRENHVARAFVLGLVIGGGNEDFVELGVVLSKALCISCRELVDAELEDAETACDEDDEDVH